MTTKAVAIRRKTVTVARRSGRRRGFGQGNNKLSLAMMGGTAVGLINAYKVGTYGPADSPNQYFQRLLLFYTGFAPWNAPGQKWQFQETRFGLAPLAAGVLIHWVANATGLNRGLAKVTRSIPVQI